MNWNAYPAERSDEESAPTIECESWIEIHSPGKNVPDGVNVNVVSLSEYAMLPLAVPLSVPHTRKLDDVIDEVDSAESKWTTIAPERDTLFALLVGDVDVTEIACANSGMNSAPNAARAKKREIDILPLRAIATSRNRFEPNTEDVDATPIPQPNADHAAGANAHF